MDHSYSFSATEHDTRHNFRFAPNPMDGDSHYSGSQWAQYEPNCWVGQFRSYSHGVFRFFFEWREAVNRQRTSLWRLSSPSMRSCSTCGTCPIPGGPPWSQARTTKARRDWVRQIVWNI